MRKHELRSVVLSYYQVGNFSESVGIVIETGFVVQLRQVVYCENQMLVL